MEQIQPIINWPHYYISNYGVVYSDKSGARRPIKLQLDSKGLYVFVNLNKNGKNKRVLVHRLVAEAFVPNPDNLPEVHHKDNNPQNNHVSNLEWCTHQVNLAHSYQMFPPTRNKNSCALWHQNQHLGDFNTIKDAIAYAKSLGCNTASMGKYLRCGEYYIIPQNTTRITLDNKTHKTQNRKPIRIYHDETLIAECNTCVDAAKLLSSLASPVSPKTIQKAYTNQTVIFNTYTIKR